MNEVYLFFFFLFDIIFLQPLKIVVSIILRFLWCPDVKGTAIQTSMILPVVNPIDANNFHEEVNNYDLSNLTNDGDGFKWLCILAGCSNSRLGYLGFRCKVMEVINSYLWNNGTIGRFPIGNPNRYTSSNFSGDMTSGLLFWLSQEVSDKDRLNLFPNEIRMKLIKVFEIVTFSRRSGHDNKKPLMCYANAREEVEEYDSTKEDRGYLYRIWGLAPDMIRLLAWFKIGYLLSGEKKYNRFYWFLRIGFAPLLFVSRGDYGIFFKKYLAVAWYTAHSNMYNLAALYETTRDSRIRKIAENLQKDFWWNVDIVGVWKRYIQNTNKWVDVSECSRYHNLICAAASKGTMTQSPTADMKDYFDIRSFEKKTLAAEWLIPQFLGHKYLWENNPLKYQTCKEDRRQNFPVDRFIATFHMTNM